jgi:hypothetical protein
VACHVLQSLTYIATLLWRSTSCPATRPARQLVAKGVSAVITVAMSSPPEGARWTVLPQRPHTEMRAAMANTGAQLASRHRARLMRRVAQAKSLAHVSTFLTGSPDTRTIVVRGLPRVAVAHTYRHAAVEIDIVL